MSVQKVINANSHDNGRAVVLTQKGSTIYSAGYSGCPSISISLSGMANLLGARLDDDPDFSVTQTVKTGRFTIGTSASGLNNLVNPQFTIHGVNLKAATTNAGVVYVGTGLNVTAGTASATDGYPLSAGQEIYVPVDDVTKLFAVATATGSLLHAFLV